MDKEKYMEQGKTSYRRELTLELSELFVLTALISFGGWVFEKIGGFIMYGSFSDRGFLTLPFCPIYGASILGIYLLVGTPRSPRGAGKRLFLNNEGKRKKGKVYTYAVYFLIAALIPTAAELAVGGIFKLAGYPLWDYSHRPLNLFGVICLYYSLLWGILITVFMTFLWDRLYRAIQKLPHKLLYSVTFMTALLLCADFLATAMYTFIK